MSDYDLVLVNVRNSENLTLMPPSHLYHIAEQMKGKCVRVIDIFPGDKLESIYVQNSKYFGFTVWRNCAKQIDEVAKVLRERHPNAKLIAGGYSPEAVQNFDIKVEGFGEERVAELLGVETKPYPPYLYPLKYSHFFPRSRYNCLSLSTSIGCPYRCSFCISGGRGFFKSKPREVIMQEFENLSRVSEKWGIRYFEFSDDVAGTHPNFEEIYREAWARFDAWGMLSRVNLFDPEKFHEWKKRGLASIYFGIESIDDAVLKSVNKGTTKGQIEDVVDSLLPYDDINKVAFLMFGLPGQTKESVLRDVEYLRGKGFLVLLSQLQIFPGTELSKTEHVTDEEGNVLETPTMDRWDVSELKVVADRELVALKDGFWKTIRSKINRN